MVQLTQSSPSKLVKEPGAIEETFNGQFGILIVGPIRSRARGDNSAFDEFDVAERKQRNIGLFTVVRAKYWLEQHLRMAVDLVFFSLSQNIKKLCSGRPSVTSHDKSLSSHSGFEFLGYARNRLHPKCF
jgi:predicted nucleotidyltransferase